MDLLSKKIISQNNYLKKNGDNIVYYSILNPIFNTKQIQIIPKTEIQKNTELLSKQIQEDEYYYDDQQQDAESKDYYYDEEQQEEYSIYLPRNLPKYLKDLQPKQQNYEIDYNKDFNNYYKNHDEIYNERNFDEVQEIPEESYYGDYFDYFQFPEEGFYFYDDGQDQQNFYFEQQQIQ